MKTASSFNVGRILGECQLLNLIARGGMGSVYVAKHLFQPLGGRKVLHRARINVKPSAR